MRRPALQAGIGLKAKSAVALLAIASTSLALCRPAVAEIPMPTSAGGAFFVGVTSWRDMPFKRVVRQQYDFSCGSAALATLLRFHYGREVGEAEIFKAMYDVGDQAAIRKVGFSLLDMKRYLSARGLSADGYKVTLADVEQLATPGIALITTGSYRHFVVIKGVVGDKVLVGDPALGTKTFSRADFEKMWTTGIFFAISQGGRGAFNSLDEWKYHFGPLKDPYLAEQSTAALLRDLPTLYQITAARTIP